MRVSLFRFLRALPLLILAPVLLAVGAIALAAADMAWTLFGRRRKPANQQPPFFEKPRAASPETQRPSSGTFLGLHFKLHKIPLLRGHEIHWKEAADDLHVRSRVKIQLLGGEGTATR